MDNYISFTVIYLVTVLHVYADLPFAEIAESNVLEGPNSDLFRVIWNSRIEQCQPKFGVTINLTRWNIEHNKPPENGWHGNVVYLVNDKFGDWPQIDKHGRIINGGVPQKMDLNKHLKAVARYIQNNITETWRGLGVLDFETYWQLFEDNMGNPLFIKYVNYSVQLVREEQPTWNESMVYQEAAREYNSASRVLWTSTIELVKKLRPGQGWGYYRFPLCLKYAPNNSTCPNKFHNDKMKWLWKSSDVLYPSIYFHGYPKMYERARRQFVFNVVSETLRCREGVGRPRLPIFVYSRFYTSLSPLMPYDMIDLINSIGMLGDLGIEGTILWGDILGEVNRTRCLETKHFIDNILGPYVVEVKKFVQHCSDVICSSHGRCYANDIPRLLNNYINEDALLENVFRRATSNSEIQSMQYEDLYKLKNHIMQDYRNKHHLTKPFHLSVYKCHCLQGFIGKHCENTV